MSNRPQIHPKVMTPGHSNRIEAKRQKVAHVADIQNAVAAIRNLPPTDDQNEKRARVKARKAKTALLHLK